MLSDTAANQLADQIRQTAFDVHCYFRHGFLEKVYENALANRLRSKGLDVRQQHRIEVRDEDGTLVGEYTPDLLVEFEIVVELKACSGIADEHIAQVLGYLWATGLRHAMLINFGTPAIQIKKLVF